jgi:hypothetical protein
MAQKLCILQSLWAMERRLDQPERRSATVFLGLLPLRGREQRN